MKFGKLQNVVGFTLFLTLLISLNSCQFIPIKLRQSVPDMPICTGLTMKPEQREVKDIGKLVIYRPNPVCMKELNEPYCGVCQNTVTDKIQYIGNRWDHLLSIQGKKKTWDTVVEESLVLPVETQTAYKAFSINVCKATNICGQQITNWRVKLDSLDSIRQSTRK